VLVHTVHQHEGIEGSHGNLKQPDPECDHENVRVRSHAGDHLSSIGRGPPADSGVVFVFEKLPYVLEATNELPSQVGLDDLF
jgi:hypothetical protein